MSVEACAKCGKDYLGCRCISGFWILSGEWNLHPKQVTCINCSGNPCWQTEDCPGGRHYERQMARTGDTVPSQEERRDAPLTEPRARTHTKLPKPTALCRMQAPPYSAQPHCMLLARWPDGYCDWHTTPRPPLDWRERIAERRRRWAEHDEVKPCDE